MPVLPLIDALILFGWSSLVVAFILKGIALSTSYRPTVFGLSAFDFLLFAIVCLLFALTLAARTWVKANETRLLRGPVRPERDAREDLAVGEPFPAGEAAAPTARAAPPAQTEPLSQAGPQRGAGRHAAAGR